MDFCPFFLPGTIFVLESLSFRVLSKFMTNLPLSDLRTLLRIFTI